MPAIGLGYNLNNIGGGTLGGGYFAPGSAGGREMFGLQSPLAQKLRGIQSTPEGDQDYKLAIMRAGLNPYDDMGGNKYFNKHFQDTPLNRSWGPLRDYWRVRDRQAQRGSQVLGITRDFVNNYQPRPTQPDPTSASGQSRSFLQQALSFG